MAKKNNGRFGGLIDQMNRDRHHLILVNVGIAEKFVTECVRRGYDMGVGSVHNDGIVLFRK